MSDATELAIFFLPTLSGFISLATSVIIVYKILSSKTKLKSPYSRLIFGLSCHDMISSFANLLTGLPLPTTISNPELYDIIAWGAVGNDMTCRLQGMLLTFTCVTSPFYNLSLCIYFYFVIRHSMSDERFRHSWEPWLHAIPIFYSLALTVYMLASNYLYVNGTMCFISSKDPSKLPFLITFSILTIAMPILLIFVGIVVFMTLITSTVWRQEKRMDQYRFGLGIAVNGREEGTEPNQSCGRATSILFRSKPATPAMLPVSTRSRHSASRNRIRAASVQANLFFAAFLLTFTFTFTYRIMRGYGIEPPVTIVLLSQGLYPLQGFFNVFAHLHPQVASIRRANTNCSYWTALFGAMMSYDEDLDKRSRSTNHRSTRSRRTGDRSNTAPITSPTTRGGNHELLNSRAARRSSRHLASIITHQSTLSSSRTAGGAPAVDSLILNSTESA